MNEATEAFKNLVKAMGNIQVVAGEITKDINKGFNLPYCHVKPPLLKEKPFTKTKNKDYSKFLNKPIGQRRNK